MLTLNLVTLQPVGAIKFDISELINPLATFGDEPVMQLGLCVVSVVIGSVFGAAIERLRQPSNTRNGSTVSDAALGQTQEREAPTHHLTNRKQTETNLEELSAFLNQVIDVISDTIFVKDEQYRFVLVNQALCHLAEMPQATFLGQTDYELFPQAQADHFRARDHYVLQTGLEDLTEEQLTTRTGEIRWLLTKKVRFHNQHGQMFLVGSSRDITARKATEIALQQQTHQEQAFNRVFQTIRNSLDLDAIFAMAAREFAELLQVNNARIMQYLPDQGHWLVLAVYLRTPGNHLPVGFQIADEHNAIAARLKQLEVVVVEDSRSLTDPVNQPIAQQTPGALLVTPLEVDGAVWGCLTCSKYPPPKTFTEMEISLARRFAEQLAIAIQQANLYQQVQQLNQELEQRVQERTTELRKSRDLFEAVFQASADAIFLVDSTSMLILECNQRAVELFEADSKTNLIGLRGNDLHKVSWSDEERARVRRELERQGVWNQEIEYRTLKNHSFWGSFASRQIYVAGLRMKLVRITDISDRKHTEAEHQQAALALRESEARFQHLAATIPGIFYQSLLRANGSRQFNYLSSGFQRIFDIDPAQLLEDADRFWQLVHPDDQEFLQAEMNRTLVNHESFQLEYRIVLPSGRVKWVHNVASREYLPNGDVVSDGVVLDISDRKQAELEIRRNRNLFEAIFQEATDAISLAEPMSNYIRDCNQRTVELFGAESKEALLGVPAHTLRKIPVTQEHLAEIFQFLQNQGVWRQECEYRTLKGRTFWGSLALKLIQVGERQMILSRVTDITDRKQAELLLQRQAEADQLLASIAQTINQSVHLDEVLGICLEQMRQFLRCDRVVVCRFDLDYNVAIEREAISQPEFSLLGQTIVDPCFDRTWAERYQQGYITACSDINDPDITPCYAGFLAQMRVRANLVVPILQADQIWGLLIAHHCTDVRQWLPFEVNLFQQLAVQIGIAGQKATLYSQLESELSTRRRAEEALAQQVQREQVLRTLSQQIRHSLRLDEVLNTTVTEVQQLLNADRAVIFRLNRDRSGVVVKESVCPTYPVTEALLFLDEEFPPECYEFYRQGHARTILNVATDEWADCLVEFMQQIGVKSKIVAPILQVGEDGDTTLWGLLIVHSCGDYRQWQPVEVDLLQQLATQVGIAIQQADLYAQIEDQLAQKEVLLKEVHHRVKNNLQVISSMLWLQAKAAKHTTVFNALEDTRNRLQAMALIHETLYESTDLGRLRFHDYIQRLVNGILAANGTRSNPIQLVYHLQPTLLNIETAIPCGLLLNELVTNAVKHAFPDGRAGELCITLEHLPAHTFERSPLDRPALHDSTTTPLQAPMSSAAASYVLIVQDNGIGLPKDLDLQKLKSLGLKIAYDLALQLRGNLELERTNGTRFRLTFSALQYRRRF